jgi:hypothetical protein
MANTYTIEGGFGPDNKFRVYKVAPATVAGRICLSRADGKPLEFKDKHAARAHISKLIHGRQS